MHSVAEILKPGFARSWHEAVALVQEVASQLPPGVAVPGPEDLLIDTGGALSLGFAAESGEHPVTGLARLLQDLLEGTNPPSTLTALATESLKSNPAHTTVDSFIQALAFFERPGRTNDLAALSRRLAGEIAVPEPKNPDEVVVELREKIAHVHEEREPAKKPAKKPANRRLVPVAAGIVACAALVAALVTLSGFGPAANGATMLDRVEQRIADVMSDGLDRLGGVKRKAEPSDIALPSTRPGRKTGVKAEAEPSSAAKASAADSTARDGKLPGTSQPSSVVPSSAIATGAPSATNGSGSSSAPASAPTRWSGSSGSTRAPAATDQPADRTPPPTVRVYSNADSDVTPPVFIRPQLPHLPEPDEKTGYFEVLINEDGDVDTVKLFSPTRRYYDRMLVAAAKAWKFQPAMRNGRPVRFKARIAIIVADPH